MADKGISVISHNGEDYNINDPNIAGEFYPNSNYAVGDHVTHEGKLYVFTAAHTGAWTGTDVTQVQIGAELHDYGAHAMVRYDVAQTLTDAQKTVARNNIGAASGSVVSEQGVFLSNLSAAVGTVPTGKTVEGQIEEIDADVADLKSAINTNTIVVDGFYPSGTVWAADNRARTLIIPVNSGDSLHLRATDSGNDSRVCMATGITLPINGGDIINYSAATGFTETIIVNKNQDYNAVIPQDAKYILVYLGLAATAFNRTPKSIQINGYDYIGTLALNAVQCSNKLYEIKNELGDYSKLQWFKGRYNNNAWLTDAYNSAYLAVTPGSTYKITATTVGSNSPVAGLKTVLLPPLDGDSIVYSEDEEWSTIRNLPKGSTIEGTIPDDVSYLYFYAGGDTLSRMVSSIIIDGYEVKNTIVENVSALLRNVSALSSTVNQITTVNNSEFPIFAREQNIRTYGHGGYTVTYPFNSLMSYRDAKQHGFNWAETDVQFTSDNVPVLCHDNELYNYARNPDGSRIGTSRTDTVFISDITYNELLYYDFGLAKSASLVGMKITSFEQLMQSAKRMNLSIAIEIKRNKTPTNEQIDILFDLIDKYHMRQNVNFCSAVTSALVYIHGKDPAMELTYIVSSITSEAITFIESIRGYNRVAIAASTTITDAMVLLAREQNIPINIGPVNSDSDILDANAYITHFTSNGPVAEEVMLNYELSQL